jgi:excisionase family DNA binding protein
MTFTVDGPPFTPREVAKLLGCSEPVAYDSVHDGTIPSVRIGRRYFIPRRVMFEILENGRIPQAAASAGIVAA